MAAEKSRIVLCHINGYLIRPPESQPNEPELLCVSGGGSCGRGGPDPGRRQALTKVLFDVGHQVANLGLDQAEPRQRSAG